MARERVNQMLASEMSLMRLMVISVLGAGEATRQFNKAMDRLQG